MNEPYLVRLASRMSVTRTCLCLGIDPDPSRLPDGLPAGLPGIERLGLLLIDAAMPHAAAVKVNLAFFEAFGSAGYAVLERLRAAVPSGVPFIADAKRGDIGATSARHAVALFDRLDAHAVTVSPYLGAEAIAPLLDRADRFAYVLCRTSNPGAAEFQDLWVDGDAVTGAPPESLALRVARRAGGWAHHPGTVGLVVGATAPGDLERVRTVAPGLPFLVPGVGSQGGDDAAALRHGRALAVPGAALPGGALLVNVSRGIAGAALGAADPEEAIASAAAHWQARLRC